MWPETPTSTWIPGPSYGGSDEHFNKAEDYNKNQVLNFGVPTVHQHTQIVAQKNSWPETPTQTWVDGPGYGNDKE